MRIETTNHYTERQQERLSPQATKIFSDLINDRLKLKEKPPTQEERPNHTTGARRKSIHFNNTRYIFELAKKQKILITAYSTINTK